MNLVFSPSQTKGENPKFMGTVTLKILSVPQKMRLMSKLTLDVSEDGVVKKDAKNLAAIADVIDEIKPYVVEVNLSHIPTGKEYKSFTDLEYADECMNILIEIAAKYLGGSNLGND